MLATDHFSWFFQFFHRRWSIGVDDGQSSMIDEMIWRFYDSSVSLWPSNVWMCHVSVSFSCKRDQSFLGIIIEMFSLIIVCLRVKSRCFSIECNYYWDREKRMLIFNSHNWKMSVRFSSVFDSNDFFVGIWFLIEMSTHINCDWTRNKEKTVIVQISSNHKWLPKLTWFPKKILQWKTNQENEEKKNDKIVSDF